MKIFIRFINKKRAISPVIAVILLIGLAVAAVAAIFLVVLPLLEPTSDLELVDAYVIYDGDYTKTIDESKGYGKGSVFLANAGTGEIKIESISVWYAQSFSSKDWTEITDAESLQDISLDEPYVLNPLETNEELTIRFPIPQNNSDTTIVYKIIVESADGTKLDTTKETGVSESDMQLVKDRPEITFTGTLDYIRRTKTISPTTVSDNPGGDIKKVTYTVSNQTWSEDQDITSSPWRWSWNTFNNIANGSYTMRMTVYDYAGLSDYVDAGSFIIDNDYIAPNVGELWITDPYPDTQTAEVGESASLTVTITDSGTEEAGASEVDEAFLFYRLDGSTDEFTSEYMDPVGTTNNWTAIISSEFFDSDALEMGVECYVLTYDLDDNNEDTSSSPKVFSVEDNYEPDITHTAIQSANWDASFINITATITDKDQVNETSVNLYYRQTDDYGGKTTSWMSLSPSISGSEYSWIIWSTDITIHGLDYFFNATDRFSGHVAYEGTEIVPHHITIPDTLVPTIYHTAYTSVTHNVSLTVECSIFDNDPTFGAEGSESGEVRLYYRDNDGGGGTVGWTFMVRTAGNSSIDNNYETPTPTTWSATIDKNYIMDDDNPSQLDYYILAIDDSTNSKQDGDPWHEASVVPQGNPNILFISDSITVGGTRGEEVYFEILNQEGSGTSAEVTKLNLTILSDTADFSSDYPKLNMTNFNGSTIEWSDSNGVANKTWITLTSPYLIGHGDGAGITMTFENTTNQPYHMYDLDLILQLEVNNSVETPYVKSLTGIKVPTGFISPLLYMTSSYTLSTLPTTNPIQSNTPWRYGSSPTVEWGIRVFVGTYEITSAPVAVVYGSQTYTEQQGTWFDVPQRDLNPTDSITISVRAIISGSEYTLADFTTGPLGAKELKGGVDWTVNYWVYYQYVTAGWDRTRAYFGFGDYGEIDSWDSFVDNFTYLPA